MIETRPILAAYADLIRRLSGASSSSMFLEDAGHDDVESTILIHAGTGAPVDELDSPEAASALRETFAEHCRTCRPDGNDPCSLRVETRCTSGILLRVPVVRPDRRDNEAHPLRRSYDRDLCRAPAVWIGLRFEDETLARPDLPGMLPVSQSLNQDSGDWWGRVLRLAAALASHSHAVAQVFEDPTTGLPARTGLRTELGMALNRARETDHGLALLFINPDDFADVNEQFGRDAGDRVMREVATRLRERVRDSDHVARYGGATLAVTLVDSDPEAAAEVAENIRSELAEVPFLDGALQLRFSVGIACVEPTARGTTDVDEWIRRADQSLYQARRDGGARTRQWSSAVMGENAETLDRLHGIFTGDISRDYRNMALLWEVVQSIASEDDPFRMTDRVVERLHSWLRAGVIAIVESAPDGSLAPIAARVHGEPPDSGWSLDEVALDRIRKALDTGMPVLIDHSAEDGAERLSCSIPLGAGDRQVGCLHLEPDSGGECPRLVDPRFLTALGSQIAVALDQCRLRLAEREREVSRREALESQVKELSRVVHAGRLSYRSDAMKSVLSTAQRVAPTEATILITGESGTGKEVLARTVHQLGDRRGQPLVIVDCGAISSTLIDSELFGHEKGAFTGAQSRKTGRLAEADGGTVFLDEIGELPVDVQSKLLRFVQEKHITPVGGSRTITVDARILAATNVDLAERVRAGLFREDLFHRLNVVCLRVPPLRERPHDISHLASVFLQQYAALYRKNALRLTPEIEKVLLGYSWPGNVRELQNRLLRAVLFSDGDTLDLDAFSDLGSEPVVGEAPVVTAAQSSVPGDPEAELLNALSREIDQVLAAAKGAVPLGKWIEGDLVIEAKRVENGVARRAATILGVPDSTFRRRLAKAERDRSVGMEVRSDTWGDVRHALHELIQANADGTQPLALIIEHHLIDLIRERCPGDIRTGAALLGVTEPTFLRRIELHAAGRTTTAD